MSFSHGYIAISFTWQGSGFARQLEMEDIRSSGVMRKWSTGVLEYWKKQRKPMPEKMPM